MAQLVRAAMCEEFRRKILDTHEVRRFGFSEPFSKSSQLQNTFKGEE